MKAVVDAHRLSENDRIDVIGRSVMGAPKSSRDKPPMNGFVVETDEKADRYIAKLTKRFPGIRIIDRNPFQGMILVRVGPPLQSAT